MENSKTHTLASTLVSEMRHSISPYPVDSCITIFIKKSTLSAVIDTFISTLRVLDFEEYQIRSICTAAISLLKDTETELKDALNYLKSY